MDLRGFTANNSGCVFEIHTLVARRLLPRTLLVVDDSTDVALLESTVRQYAVASDETAACQEDMPPIHVSHLTAQSGAELARVYEHLKVLAAT